MAISHLRGTSSEMGCSSSSPSFASRPSSSSVAALPRSSEPGARRRLTVLPRLPGQRRGSRQAARNEAPAAGDPVATGRGRPGRRKESIRPDVGANAASEGVQRAGGAAFKNLPVVYGSRSRPGSNAQKKRKTNQDTFVVQDCFGDMNNQSMVAVFDGHGPNGHVASRVVRDLLQYAWLDAIGSGDIHKVWASSKALERATRKAFVETNKKVAQCKVDMNISGTTGTTMLLCENLLLAANVGDSRIVVGKQMGGTVRAYDLTRDHKPDEKDEEKRILAADGRVFNWGVPRVWLKNIDMPGLAVSRSFGDLAAESVGVFAEPEIKRFTMAPQHRVIIAASDGVWEFISSQEAVDIAMQYCSKRAPGAARGDDPQAACDALVEESVRRWNNEEAVVDDITAVVLFLSYRDQSGSS